MRRQNFSWLGVRYVLALAMLPIGMSLSIGSAEAHGGGPGLTYDPCIRQTGTGEFVHLAVYQPGFNPFAEYCDALPAAGPALIVFDLMCEELPADEVWMELRRPDGTLQLSRPPRRYRSGIASLQANLPAGTYKITVSIAEAEGRRQLEFPLIVGARWSSVLTPIAAMAVIAFATCGYCIFQIRLMASDRPRLSSRTPTELRSVKS